MFKILSISGLILALNAPVAHAQVDTLYMRIKNNAEQEEQSKESEAVTERHAAAMYYFFKDEIEPFAEKDTPFSMEETHIDMAVVQPPIYGKLCDVGDNKPTHDKCVKLRDLLEHLTERDVWLREVGRELQLIAVGYENGLYGYPGGPINLTGRLGSIMRIWRAGNDPYVTPILEDRVRGGHYRESAQGMIDGKFGEVIDEIKKLKKTRRGKDDEKNLTAAVFRYRHGYKYVESKEGACNENETPSDLSILEQRYCALEQKLEDLFNVLEPNMIIMPSVGRGEAILFPSLIEEEENIMIWVRKDDIGLRFLIPNEPVFPTLYGREYEKCMEGEIPAPPSPECAGHGLVCQCWAAFGDNIIRGGNYPERDTTDGRLVPEPSENDGICSHPFMRKGYLCRDVDDGTCKVLENDYYEARRRDRAGLTDDTYHGEDDDGGNTIYLTRCQPERFNALIEEHISGPDICERGGWRGKVSTGDSYPAVADTPDKDPDMKPPRCAKCAIDLYCGNNCGGSSTARGYTDVRDEKGVVRVCINPSNMDPPELLEYTMLHEMVHAQQYCKLSTLEASDRISTKEGCCALEREAFLVSCKQMALDGVLEEAGLSIDECATAKANSSCFEWRKKENPSITIDDLDGDGAADSGEDPKDLTIENACSNDGLRWPDIVKKIDDAVKVVGPTIGLQTDCRQAITTLTGSLLHTIKDSLPLACEPGCKSAYENTIGNNLCFAGQCIEQSHEMHRLNPGYMTLVSGGVAFPWDARIKEDPEIGEAILPPALIPPQIPPYMPQYLMDQLDTALCQLNGLPAKAPPVMCSFDPRKRLTVPIFKSYLGQAQSLSQQYAEVDITALGIEGAASAIGARITSDLLLQYLRPASRAYADIIDMAQILLNKTGDLQIPQDICPL